MVHKEFEIPLTKGVNMMNDDESFVTAMNKVKKEELEGIRREVKEEVADLKETLLKQKKQESLAWAIQFAQSEVRASMGPKEALISSFVLDVLFACRREEDYCMS